MSVGSLSSATLGDQIAVAVGKKALDSAKQQGQAAMKLIESAAPANVAPSVGRSLNIVG
ncbi:MAG: putative motility protein [Polyangiaceae bacterium]